MKDYQLNINGMSSSPEKDAWFDQMFARREKVLLTSDYDEEEITNDDDVDTSLEDDYSEQDDLM
jgi:hypothetical protein